MPDEKRNHDWTDRISPELRQECVRLYENGATYRTIKQHLAGAGHIVGLSSVGRWAAKRRRERYLATDPALLVGRAVCKFLAESGLYLGVRK